MCWCLRFLGNVKLDIQAFPRSVPTIKKKEKDQSIKNVCDWPTEKEEPVRILGSPVTVTRGSVKNGNVV